MAKPSKQRSTANDVTPAMEWILGSIGAVLFLIGIAFLTIEGLRGEDQPGEITFHVDEIVPSGNLFLVRFTATNSGTQTLADLKVSAELRSESSLLDEAEATLDFLPGHSSRSGGFYLREDPRRNRLELRAGGYQEP